MASTSLLFKSQLVNHPFGLDGIFEHTVGESLTFRALPIYGFSKIRSLYSGHIINENVST